MKRQSPKVTKSAEALARFQAIDREFHRELWKRSSFSRGGYIELARLHDRNALRACAGVGYVLVEQLAAPEHLEDLKEWLVDALHRVAGGEEPNDAFGWSRSGRGRPGRQFEQLKERWLVVQTIAGAIAENPAIQLKAAIGKAATLHNVRDATAAQYWKEAAELKRKK